MNYNSSVLENDALYGADDLDEINRRMDSLFKQSEERKIGLPQNTPRTQNRQEHLIQKILE